MEFEIEEFKFTSQVENEQVKDELQLDRQKSKMSHFQRKDMIILQRISENYNFMIVNDLFLWKDAFSQYYVQESIGFCPLNKYRPPIQSILFQNYGYTLHEDTYHGYTDPSEINCICQILESLQINKAYEISQFIKQTILPKQISNIKIKQDILQFYSENVNEILKQINLNFERSLILANSFLAMLTKQNNRIIKYQIKKFCFETMSHIIYSNGGSLGLADLIQGDYSFIRKEYNNLLEYFFQYCRNIQLPEILDQRGLIDINIAFITGAKEIDVTILTVEGFPIPCKARIVSYPLSETTLKNGYKLSDELNVIEFIINPQIIAHLQEQRKQIDELLISGKLCYSTSIDPFYSLQKIGKMTERQSFISKFYPDIFIKQCSKSKEISINLEKDIITGNTKQISQMQNEEVAQFTEQKEEFMTSMNKQQNNTKGFQDILKDRQIDDSLEGQVQNEYLNQNTKIQITQLLKEKSLMSNPFDIEGFSDHSNNINQQNSDDWSANNHIFDLYNNQKQEYSNVFLENSFHFSS